MTSDVNNSHFCWEQVDKTDRLFRISHLFASHRFAEPLLAIHALFASIDQIAGSSGDEHVTEKRIEWWHSELQPENISKSRHPVVKQLNDTGAVSADSFQHIQELIDGAIQRIQKTAPSSSRDLHSLFHLIYHPRIQWEYNLLREERPATVEFPAAFISGGLLELLRESSGGSERAFWWLPLDLLATHGVSRRELVSDFDSDR
jgi:hypothetical protein